MIHHLIGHFSWRASISHRSGPEAFHARPLKGVIGRRNHRMADRPATIGHIELSKWRGNRRVPHVVESLFDRFHGRLLPGCPDSSIHWGHLT
jgi:hypothetical protein